MKPFKAPPFITSEFNVALDAIEGGGSTLRVGVLADPVESATRDRVAYHRAWRAGQLD
jgi:hypothetical protein